MNGKLDIENKRLRMEGGVACSIRKSLSCSQKPNFCGDTNSPFIDIFLHQSKPIFVALLHRPSSKPEFIEHLDTQQTFVVFVFRRRLDQDQYIHSSWSYVFKTSSRHLQKVLQRYLQNAFKRYNQAILFL